MGHTETSPKPLDCTAKAANSLLLFSKYLATVKLLCNQGSHTASYQAMGRPRHWAVAMLKSRKSKEIMDVNLCVAKDTKRFHMPTFLVVLNFWAKRVQKRLHTSHDCWLEVRQVRPSQQHTPIRKIGLEVEAIDCQSR